MPGGKRTDRGLPGIHTVVGKSSVKELPVDYVRDLPPEVDEDLRGEELALHSSITDNAKLSTKKAEQVARDIDKMRVDKLAGTTAAKHTPQRFVPEDLNLKPIPEETEERIAWTREAFARAAPIAAQGLIDEMLLAPDAWSRHRARLEILDRNGFHRGNEAAAVAKAPMVIVNIKPSDIWRSGPVVDAEVIDKEE